MFKELVSNFTAKGIRNIGNVVEKDNKELSTLLLKLAKSKGKGEQLSSTESKKLVNMLQDFRRNTPAYQARRKSFLEQLAKKKKTNNKAANTTEKVTEKTTANKAADTSIKSEVGNTLSARWAKLKTLINNHPKLAVGVPLLALGTGPGRYVTGNALKFTQSNPESWFGEQPQQATNAQDFIMINGTKIPIKRSSEGYFIPAEDNIESSQTMQEGDAIDAALAGITNENLGVPTQSQQGNFNIPDQQTINDLFSEDQW